MIKLRKLARESQIVTLYMRSGNVVKLPVFPHGDVIWKHKGSELTELEIKQAGPGLTGLWFDLESIEGFTVEIVE
jgi:hypothetical protein